MEQEKMEQNINNDLMRIASDATQYCATVENVREMEKDEFVQLMTEQLPRIYSDFLSVGPEDVADINGDVYYQEYVDEEWYDTVRRNMERVLGPDDVFLETFEEDMKYSDTPIAVSVSECLADIFQVLYNFAMIVKESEGSELTGAYLECRENFAGYWSQTLCNVLRALNNIRFNS